MQKLIHLNFLKTIISSDFLILKKKSKRDKIFSNKYTKYYKDYQILDLLETNKDLKKFIRIIQFIKKEKGVLNILINNDQIYHILKQNFTNESLLVENNINLLTSLKDVYLLNNNIKKDKLSFFFIVGNDFLTKKLIGKLVENQIFFLSTVSSSNMFKESGIYTIHNELDDIKKSLFLSSIITQIYKNA